MCRLLGVVCSETTDFRFSLHEAPRSLAFLSTEHKDGWGLAVHRRDVGWDLHRNPVRAGDCDRFKELAARARGELLLAHIRKRTVGPIGEKNTHPFQRGGFVFAHNGTIENIAAFSRTTSAARAREIEGDTDSEQFFAHLLTVVDELGHDRVDDALRRVVAQPIVGAANFLLSNGASLWAHRLGRTLFSLERHPGDPVRVSRHATETDADLETPWSARRHAVLIASERMTDEPWEEIPERTLMRIDAGTPRVTIL